MRLIWWKKLETRDEAMKRGSDPMILGRAKELFGSGWEYDTNGTGQKTDGVKLTHCQYLIKQTLKSFVSLQLLPEFILGFLFFGLAI